MKKIYVGNLSFKTTEPDLEAAFAPFGTVLTVSIITDRQTGRPRGFGFVEMENDEEAAAAIEGLNGKELGGRTIAVNESKPREEDAGGGRGRGGGGGRGGRGGGGGRGGRSGGGYSSSSSSSGSAGPSDDTASRGPGSGGPSGSNYSRPDNDDFASGL